MLIPTVNNIAFLSPQLPITHGIFLTALRLSNRTGIPTIWENNFKFFFFQTCPYIWMCQLDTIFYPHYNTPMIFPVSIIYWIVGYIVYIHIYIIIYIYMYIYIFASHCIPMGSNPPAPKSHLQNHKASSSAIVLRSKTTPFCSHQN